MSKTIYVDSSFTAASCGEEWGVTKFASFIEAYKAAESGDTIRVVGKASYDSKSGLNPNTGFNKNVNVVIADGGVLTSKGAYDSQWQKGTFTIEAGGKLEGPDCVYMKSSKTVIAGEEGKLAYVNSGSYCFRIQGGSGDIDYAEIKCGALYFNVKHTVDNSVLNASCLSYLQNGTYTNTELTIGGKIDESHHNYHQLKDKTGTTFGSALSAVTLIGSTLISGDQTNGTKSNYRTADIITNLTLDNSTAVFYGSKDTVTKLILKNGSTADLTAGATISTLTLSGSSTVTIGAASTISGTVSLDDSCQLLIEGAVDFGSRGKIIVTLTQELDCGETLKVIDFNENGSMDKSKVSVVDSKGKAIAGYEIGLDAENDIAIINKWQLIDSAEKFAAADLSGYIKFSGMFEVSDLAAQINWNNVKFDDNTLLLWYSDSADGIPQSALSHIMLKKSPRPIDADGKINLSGNDGYYGNDDITAALEIVSNGSAAAEIRSDIDANDNNVSITNNQQLNVTGSVTNAQNIEIYNNSVLNGASNDLAAVFEASDEITFVNDGHAVVDLRAREIAVENNSVNTIENSSIGYDADGSIVADTVVINAEANADGVVRNSEIGATQSVTIADQSVSQTAIKTGTMNVYGESNFAAGNTYDVSRINFGSVDNAVDAEFDMTGLKSAVVAQNGTVTLTGKMDENETNGFQLAVGGTLNDLTVDTATGATTVNIGTAENKDALFMAHQVMVGATDAVNEHTLNVYGTLDANRAFFVKPTGNLNVYGKVVALQLQGAGDVLVSGADASVVIDGNIANYGIKVGTDADGKRSSFVITNGAAVDSGLLMEVGYSTDRHGDLEISNGGKLNVEKLAVQSGSTVTIDAASTLTATSLTNAGTITIDADGYTGGTVKVINLSQSSKLTDVILANNSGEYFLFCANDGDVILTKPSSVVYINAAWSDKQDGDIVGDGYIIGYNAVSSLADTVNMIKTDGSDTTIKLIGDSSVSGDQMFNYGDGAITFTADSTVTVTQNSNQCGFYFITGDKTSKITVGENVTFKLSDNVSDFAVWYGASITVDGTVTGGANWGAFYLFYGNGHIISSTGTVSTGRVHVAFTDLNVNGDASSARTDAHIDTNYLLIEGGTFNATNAIIDANVIYDNNNGGQRYGASEFNIDNSKLTAGKVTLSYADSTMNVTGASTVDTNLEGSGVMKIDGAELDGTLNVAWRDAALDANNKVVTHTGNLLITGTNTLNGKIDNSVQVNQGGGEPNGISDTPDAGGLFYAPYQNNNVSGKVLMGSADKAADITLNGSIITGSNTSLLKGSMVVNNGAGIYGMEENEGAWMNQNVHGNYDFAIGDMNVYGTADNFDVTYDGTDPIAKVTLESGAEIARLGYIWVGSDQHDKGSGAYVLDVKDGASITDFANLTLRGDAIVNVDGTIESFSTKSFKSSSQANANNMFENATDGGISNNNGVINVSNTGFVKLNGINIGRKPAYGEAELNIDGGTVEFGSYGMHVGYSSRDGKVTLKNGAVLKSTDHNIELHYNNGYVAEILTDQTVAAGALNIGVAGKGSMDVSSSTVDVAKLNNNSELNVTGASDIAVDTLSGSGKINFTDASLDADTVINSGEKNGSNVGNAMTFRGNNTVSGSKIYTGWNSNINVGDWNGADASASLNITDGAELVYGGAAYIGTDAEDKGASANKVTVTGATFAGHGGSQDMYIRRDGELEVKDNALASFGYVRLKGAVNVSNADFKAINVNFSGSLNAEKANITVSGNITEGTGAITLSNGSVLSVSDIIFGTALNVQLANAIRADHTNAQIIVADADGNNNIFYKNLSAGQTTIDLFTNLPLGTYTVTILAQDNVFEVYSGIQAEITTYGSLTMDFTSQVKFSGDLNVPQGSITVDTSAYTAGTYKLFDYTGSDIANRGEAYYRELFIDTAWNDKYVVVNGDLLITDQNTETIYVNNAYTGNVGDITADGKIIGYNAAGSFESAIKFATGNGSSRIELMSDINDAAVVNPGKTYEIAEGQNLTIGTVSGATATVDINRVAGKTYSIYQMTNNSSLTIEAGVTLKGLDIVACGFATSGNFVTINGRIEALSLKEWTSNGGITINETGSVWLGYGDGQLDLAYGNGYLTVNGTLTDTGDAALGEAQLKAGYSGTRGNGNKLNLNNTFMEAGAWFTVAGSNGTFNIKNSVLKVYGGDASGYLTVSSSGNVFNLTDNSRLVVAQLTLNANNTINAANSSLELKTVTNSGEISVENSTFTANSVTNNGTISVSGISTLNITTLTGDEEVNFLDGAIIKDSTIGGNVFVAGNVTFHGDNTFAMLYDYGTLTDYYGTTAPMKWTVERGASLTLTTAARYGLGYGDDVTILGNITDAKTARESLTDDDLSFFTHGLVAQESKGWNCDSKFTVKDAYVEIGSNNSFGNKPGNYGGTYTFNFENAVVTSSRITFYEALSTTTFTFKNSDVKTGTFMTNDADSTFVLDNTKLLSTTTTNGTDEGNYNAGKLNLINGSELTYSAAVTNKANAEINITGSTLTLPSLVNVGKVNVENGVFDADSVTNNGTFKVAGESKLVVDAMTGTIEASNGATIYDSVIKGGNGYTSVEKADAYTYVLAANGVLNFKGNNSFIQSVEAGAGDTVNVTDEITFGADGFKLGDGAVWNIEDATVNSSYGLSLDGNDLTDDGNDPVSTMNVKNSTFNMAQISAKGDSSATANYNIGYGTFNVNFEGSTVNLSNRLQIQAQETANVNINFTGDSEVSALHFINYSSKGAVTFDDSKATFTQNFGNAGTVNILNGATVNATYGTSGLGMSGEKPNGNSGTINVTGSTFALTGGSAFANTGAISVTNSTFTVTGTITNSGSITIDAASTLTANAIVMSDGATITINADGYTGLKLLIDQTNGTSLEGKVVLNGTGVSAIYNEEGDVFITDASADVIYVNSAWSSYSIGEKFTFDGKELIYSFNAFDNVKAAVSKANELSGGTVNLLDTPYAYAAPLTSDADALTITNAGNYTITGGNGALLNYELEINPDKLAGDYNVTIDDAFVTLTKFTLRDNADVTVTDSRLDFNPFLSGSWFSVYRDSKLTVSNSTIGYNPSKTGVADPDEFLAGNPTADSTRWGTVLQVYGDAEFTNSTLFLTDNEGGHSNFSVKGNGNVTFTNSYISNALFNVGFGGVDSKYFGSGDDINNLNAKLTISGSTIRNTQYRGDNASSGIRVGEGNRAGTLVITNSDIDMTVVEYTDSNEYGLTVYNGSVTVTNSKVSVSKFANSGTVSLTGSTLTTGAVTNSGSITISVADGGLSKLTGTTLTNSGTITIDVTGYTGGEYKVIDLDQTTALSGLKLVDNDKIISAGYNKKYVLRYAADGDVYVSTRPTTLYVNSDYNSSTDGYGYDKFNNYQSALNFAIASGDTQFAATIVIEKTTTISGNCLANEHGHKDTALGYPNLSVVVKDGATLWMSPGQTVQMIYSVTIEGGANFLAAVPSSKGTVAWHLKKQLTVGDDSGKRAYVNMLDNNGYGNYSLQMWAGGSVVLKNSDFRIKEILYKSSNSFTATGSNITVGGTVAVSGASSMTLEKSKLEAASLTVTGSSGLFAGNTTVTLNASILSTGSINVTGQKAVFKMDMASTVAFQNYTGNKITVSNIGSYSSGTYKLLDYTGSGSYDEAGYRNVINWNDNFTVFNNDLYLTKETDSTIYVDNAYTGRVGDITADGKIIGYNAAGSFESALEFAIGNGSSRIELMGDINDAAVVNPGETYVIAEGQNLTVGTVSGATATVDINRAAGNTYSIYQMTNNSSLTIEAGVTLKGLDIVACGFVTSGNFLTINGRIEALSLKEWTSNGGITINETGSVWLGYGDGQLDLAYGNGYLTVNGTLTDTSDAALGEAQLKAGYSGTRGNGNKLNLNNTFMEAGAWFTVAGSNGTFNIKNSVLKVYGGDASGYLTVSSSGNVFNLTDNSRLVVAQLNLNANNTINAANSSLELKTVTNSGEINVENSTFTADSVTTSGTISITNGVFTANSVDNTGAFDINGGTVAIGTLKNTIPGRTKITGETLITVNSLTGNNSLWLLDGVTLLEGSAIYGVTVRAVGDTVTIGKADNGSDGEISFTEFDNRISYVWDDSVENYVGSQVSQELVINDTMNVTGSWFCIFGASDDNVTVVNGSGKIVVNNTNAIFQKGKTEINVDVETGRHLRFTNTDITVTGTISATVPDSVVAGQLTALQNANVTLNGGTIDTAHNLLIGYNTYVYDDSISVNDKWKSKLEMLNGGRAETDYNLYLNKASQIIANNGTLIVGGNAYTYAESEIALTNSTFTVTGTITNSGKINLNDNSVLTAGSVVNNGSITLTGNAALNGDIALSGSGMLNFGTDAAAYTGSEFSNDITGNGDSINLVSGTLLMTGNVIASTASTDLTVGKLSAVDSTTAELTLRGNTVNVDGLHIGAPQDMFEAETDLRGRHYLIIDDATVIARCGGQDFSVRNTGKLDIINGGSLTTYGNSTNKGDILVSGDNSAFTSTYTFTVYGEVNILATLTAENGASLNFNSFTIGHNSNASRAGFVTIDNATAEIASLKINANEVNGVSSGMKLLNGAKLTAGTITNAGGINMSWDSCITVGQLSGSAYIYVDATGWDGTVRKVVDVTGGVTNYKVRAQNLTDGKLIQHEKDYYLVKVDNSIIYVDSKYDSFEAAAADGLVLNYNAFNSVSAGIDGQWSNTQKVVIRHDFTESVSCIEGNITTDVAGGVVINSTYTDYIEVSDATIGENVTFKNGAYYFCYGTVNINGAIEASDVLYNGYGTTVNVNGKLTTAGTSIIRFNSNAEAGMYVVGTAAAGKAAEAEVSYKSGYYTGFYSGTLKIKDAKAEAGYFLLKNSYDSGYAPANLVLDNAHLSTVGTGDGQKQFIADGNASITMSNKSALDVLSYMNVNSATVEINVADSTLKVGETLTNAGKINLNNNSVLTAGSVVNSGTITVNGSTFTAGSVANNGDICLTNAVFKANVTGAGNFIVSGNVAIDSAYSVANGSLTVNQDSALTVAGSAEFATVENNGTITVDWTASFGFADIDNNGTFAVDLTGYKGDAEGKVVLDHATGWTAEQYKALLGDSWNDAYFTVNADGDLVLNGGVVTTVYVSSNYSATGANDGHEWGVDAFDNHADALAKKPQNIIVSGGTFTASCGHNGSTAVIETGSFKNVYAGGADGSVVSDSTSLTIKAGSFSNVYGGSNINTPLTVNQVSSTELNILDGKFSGYVIGGDYVKDGIVISESSNLTISGGTFTKNVAGGMMLNTSASSRIAYVSVEDINFTISGGSFATRVYGGNFALTVEMSHDTVVTGDINLVIDATQNNITFGEHIVAGSYGYGKVEGDVTVTFSKAADKTISFAADSIVLGASGNGYTMVESNGTRTPYSFVYGDRTVAFDSYSGDFGAVIKMFSDIDVTGNSNVNFTSSFSFADISDWDIEFGSSLSGIASNDFTGDSIDLDLTGFDGSDWTVMVGTENALSSFDSATLTLSGAGADQWIASGYGLKLEDTEDGAKRLVFGQLA